MHVAIHCLLGLGHGLLQDSKHAKTCAQATIGPNGVMAVQDAGDPGSDPDASQAMSQHNQEAFDEAMANQRLPFKQQELECRMREFFLHQNKDIAKDGQSRDQRFVHKGKLEPDKVQGMDGYVSDDDCIAVLYDITPGGPRRKKKQYAVYFGSVTKVTYDRVGKRVPGARAHLKERSGEAVCKWFDEKLSSNKKGHATHNGKEAYHLKLYNPTGFNDKVEFPMILCGVRMRMTVDCEHDCWLLDPADFDYVEKQRDRWPKYQNSTLEERELLMDWEKDVRKGHDKMKTKVCVELGIDI